LLAGAPPTDTAATATRHRTEARCTLSKSADAHGTAITVRRNQCKQCTANTVPQSQCATESYRHLAAPDFGTQARTALADAPSPKVGIHMLLHELAIESLGAAGGRERGASTWSQTGELGVLTGAHG
jgi:hypothetical protein